MFGFLTFTVYINTYINILHEKPNSEKEKTKMKKAEENVGGGGRGRTDTAGVYVSVHFMLEAGQCRHTDSGVYVGNSINSAFS